jgi:plasmid maintenance system antidote protein VapI
MIGVDKIGKIRCAYFEQHQPIKEIVRTLSVSRATVRKIICSQRNESKYGAWGLGRCFDADPGAGSQAAEARASLDPAPG